MMEGDSWLMFWGAVVAVILILWVVYDWKKKGSP